MIRLTPDHTARLKRAPKVTFTFDRARVEGHAGESLAAALMRAGHLHLRDAPEDDAPRGAFCLMGLCQECVVELDGLRVESCLTELRDGMVVTSLRRGAHG